MKVLNINIMPDHLMDVSFENIDAEIQNII